MLGEDLVAESNLTGARKWAASIVEHKWFAPFITAIIVLNAITLGMGTYDVWPAAMQRGMILFDGIVTSIFVLEIGLKLIAYRWRFFKSGWNVFDLAIVSIALAPGTGAMSVLRAMRVLRVLRLVSVVPMLRRIVEALLRAIPGMGAILAVLALMVYVAAVMATTMYSESNPDLFGSLPASALSLFQVMTMDGWRMEVVQPVMDAGHPYAWVFFLTYIILASFAVLNLFMALIVESLSENVQEDVQEIEEAADAIKEGQEEAHLEREELVMLVKSMREEMAQLKDVVSEQLEASRDTKRGKRK